MPPPPEWHESHLMAMKVLFKNFSSVSLKMFSLVSAEPASLLMRFPHAAPSHPGDRPKADDPKLDLVIKPSSHLII